MTTAEREAIEEWRHHRDQRRPIPPERPAIVGEQFRFIEEEAAPLEPSQPDRDRIANILFGPLAQTTPALLPRGTDLPDILMGLGQFVTDPIRQMFDPAARERIEERSEALLDDPLAPLFFGVPPATVAAPILPAIASARGLLPTARARPPVPALPPVTRQISEMFPAPLREGSEAQLRALTRITRPPRRFQGTVVAEGGRPRIVYHGTQRAFTKFDPGRFNPDALYGPGAYFTEQPTVAAFYAGVRNVGNIRPAYLNVRRVFDIDAPANPTIVAKLKQLDLPESPFMFEFGRDVDELVTNDHVYSYLLSRFGNRSEVNDWLQANGFEAITHIGGKLSGRSPHRVWIVLGDEAGNVEQFIHEGSTITRSMLAKPSAKVIEQFKALPSRQFTPPLKGNVVTPTQETIQKLTNAFQQAQVARLQLTAAQSRARGQRITRFRESLEAKLDDADIPTQQAFREALGEMKGTLAEAEFGAIAEQFTAREIDDLTQWIVQQSRDDFDLLGNFRAFNGLFWESRVPQPAELLRLERLFGSELVEGVLRLRKAGIWQNTVDIIGLPRSIIASYDLSAPLRQGWILVPSHLRQTRAAFGAQFRALVSEKNFRAVDRALRSDPDFGLAEASGLYQAPIVAGVGRVSQREEAIISRYVDRFFFTRPFSRAYVAYLNKLRFDVFKFYVNQWKNTGKTLQDYKDLARFVNVATGRGTLPRGEALAQALNIIGFSPRFAVSRPEFLIRAGVQTARGAREGNLLNRGVSRAWAVTSVAAFAQGFAALQLMKLAGADVELNPLSSDFGKGRWGTIRIDFWGGFQPYFRHISQLITGRRKTLGTGDIVGVDRPAVVNRFLRSKLSPGAQSAADVFTGRTFLGEEVTAEPEFVKRYIEQHLSPMFFQDLKEAVAGEGMRAIPYAMPGVFGVGFQRFETIGDIKQATTQRMFQEGVVSKANYDELTLSEQDKVNRDPQVQQSIEELEARRGRLLRPEEEFRVAMQSYRENVDTLIQDLRGFIDANTRRDGSVWLGVRGREAIKEFSENKAQAWDSNVRQEVEEFRREGMDDLRDIWRDRYWSVELETDPETRIPNFEKYERDRAAVLVDAVAAGVDPDDVTFRQPVDDPQVQPIIEQYRADIDALRPWFEFERNFMDRMGLLDEWNAWRAEDPVNRDAFLDRQPAFDEAKKAVDRFQREVLRANNPDLERMLFRWGFITEPVNEAIEREGPVLRLQQPVVTAR